MKTTTNPSHRLALSLIFWIMLMDVMGVTILYPVAAYIVRQYSPQALSITLLSAIYAAAQFIAAPVLGQLSDRLGRRPVLLVSLIGSAIGYLIFGTAGALWVLFLSRLIDGITGGNMSTASAYIADVSRPEEQAQNFALIGLAWGIGLVLGPALGGYFGQLSLRAPALIAVGLSIANLVLCIFWLPETLPPTRRDRGAMRLADFNPLAPIRRMGNIPGLGVLLVVSCLFNFAAQGMTSTETLYLIHRFAALPWQVGFLLVLAGVTTALVQMTVQPLVRRLGEKVLASISLPAMALSAVAICLSPVFLLIYPLIIFRSIASGYIYSTLSTLNTRQVSGQELGVLMGVTTALTSLMTILGPLLCGIAYDHWLPAAPYWIAAGLMGIAAVLLWPVGKINKILPVQPASSR